MKKMMFILLVAVCVGTAFAQAKAPTPAPAATAPESGAKKNSIALDAFPLFKGIIASDSSDEIYYFFISAGYERLLVPHFSIGADLDLYIVSYGGTGGMYLGMLAEGRYYPQSESFEKFFLGTTFGLSMLSIDGSFDYGFVGLTTSLKTGYKLIFPKNLYVEPSLSYVLAKYSEFVPTPLGWQGGLRIGFAF